MTFYGKKENQGKKGNKTNKGNRGNKGKFKLYFYELFLSKKLQFKIAKKFTNKIKLFIILIN
jgi:hypothetical protein